jgi:hypothetical protein
MDRTISELIRLRHAVVAMRDWIVPNLDALERQIDALVPKHDAPAKTNYDVKSWFDETSK